jgi:hypothetical protein
VSVNRRGRRYRLSWRAIIRHHADGS